MLREAGAADAQSLGLQAYLAPDDPLGPAMLAGVIGSLAPAIAGHGLADPAELDVATLRDQIAAEQKAAGSAMVVPTLVAAWGHPG